MPTLGSLKTNLYHKAPRFKQLYPMPILFLTVVIDLIGFGIILPIIPFVAPQLGGDDMDIAMIIAIYSVFAGLCGSFWGKLSDRFGRKPIILICLAGTSISYLMLAFSTSLLMLYLARAVCGIMAGSFGVASAMVADITTIEDRARGMGIIGAAFGLGFVIGPLLGGVLSGEEMSFMRPGLAAACFSFLAFIAAALFLKESLTADKRAQHAQHDDNEDHNTPIFILIQQSGNSLLIAQFLLFSISVSSVAYLFPLMTRDFAGWGAREIGIVFSIQGLVLAIMQAFIAGRLSRLFGELPTLCLGLFFMVLGQYLYVFIAIDISTIVAALFITITGSTVCMPILNSLATQRSKAHLRGRIMGTTASVAAWGRVIAPLMGGVLLQAFGYTVAWLAIAVCGSLMLLWVISEIKNGAH